MPATMKDIAKKAGVSVVTVSRALNNKPDINENTKKIIIKIAADLDYTPDSLAKSLVTKKTSAIGIIVPTMDFFYTQVVDGISKVSLDNNYSIVLCNSHEDPNKELRLIRSLREKRVDGMLIYPIQADHRYIEELKNSVVPFVFLNRHTDELQCEYVINDNVFGAYSAVNHLIQRGYKKILYICAKPNASSGKERIEGCKKACLESNISLHSLTVLTCKEKIESCYRLVKNLLSKDFKHDAVFVWDDRLAIGAIKAVLEYGKRIPQDIGIIGYDDIEISEYLFPPLTTIRHPSYEIGETAAEILINRLESINESAFNHIVLKPKLIVRETT
jgi:LacI family transcriptional regulator